MYRVIDPFSGKALESRKAAELMSDGLCFDLEPNSAAVRHLRAEG